MFDRLELNCDQKCSYKRLVQPKLYIIYNIALNYENESLCYGSCWTKLDQIVRRFFRTFSLIFIRILLKIKWTHMNLRLKGIWNNNLSLGSCFQQNTVINTPDVTQLSKTDDGASLNFVCVSVCVWVGWVCVSPTQLGEEENVSRGDFQNSRRRVKPEHAYGQVIPFRQRVKCLCLTDSQQLSGGQC